ncbi:cobaltochelatase subunit CobN [Pseudomaricurvus alkylphenolicus]|uniref:cobaltochelatase subunit CobN n=1 Tax=Pseudomaricurvus alkylphenolicus TaxID=1306991 RepID=UPI001F0D953B|nr:cobaltochelatase subunit CobN [Pseudomaricurvus alkylphenolicus]
MVSSFCGLARTGGVSTMLCLGAWLLIAFNLQAATVVAVVSPRNAPDVLSGAHRFLQAHSDHRILLRTTDQFIHLSEADRHKLLAEADLVFAGGVFGETAEWLNRFVNHQPNSIPSFVAVHSDRRLVRYSHVQRNPLLVGADIDALMAEPPADRHINPMDWASQQLANFARYRPWLLAKTFWADRDSTNMDGLFRHLMTLAGAATSVPDPQLRPSLRIFHQGKPVSPENLTLAADKRWVALLDYETGDRPGERELLQQLCSRIEGAGHGCLWVLAKWGPATVKAVQWLLTHKDQLGAVVSVQNFVMGGGEGRESVNKHLAQLNVPVLKALRLTDSSADEWLLSEEGLRWDSVHYRVAMPELQGVAEPMVAAAMTVPSLDKLTGVELSRSQPIESQVSQLARRLDRWLTLQQKANRDKRVAIVYYNHPPGRHNIGADNLNVPESLFQILQQLKAAGYDTGELPESQQALLDLLQERGVNLPEDRQALAAMAKKVSTVEADQYQHWFEQLPVTLQQEMENGPLGYLHNALQRAVTLEDRDIGERLLRRVVEDLHHAIDGADHPARERVERLLQQLKSTYNPSPDTVGNSKVDWERAGQLVQAIADTGVEGLRGWGKAPGKVMVHDNRLLIPGLQFGKVFVGPQPPRGWELNEELLHANLSFPPPHQYLAFYQWIRNGFGADAVVHLGRHSTYEFLPRHRVGMSQEDYPLALLDDLPSVYPYIVDGVGEGIQAKRRGLAVMVDHLTPPLESTQLYDRLLELRQLVESYEAAPEAAGAMRDRAIVAIKALVEELKLRDELVASMSGELEVRGITEFDQVDDELLVHEVGHYLTHLQEDFMPLGLHVFGRDWTPEAVDTLLGSMLQDRTDEPESVARGWRQKLADSPAAEAQALLNGLNGRYIAPGKGNDPIRTPEALPTGRNFFALDGSLIPSRLGYQVGVELAQKARTNTSDNRADDQGKDSDAVVLWASDVVRDEGAMIAFGFDMLGVQPEWSSRGIVTGLKRLDVGAMTEFGQPRQRHDTVFTTSGLFRDLYGAHLVWLERAVLMALDASADLIVEQYPALTLALNNALTPLGSQRSSGKESLAINLVAARWVEDARLALRQGLGAEQAGRQATYRIFGDAPGTYGAGVNRMVERSGSWQDRAEVAQVYLRRMGHAYGANLHGEPALDTFRQRLANVSNTYMGRSSNLYGLLDNNDAFDYLGGLSLAVETVKGDAPESFILFHPDSENLSMEPLQVALLSELRGRFLNPQWLSPLMDEGYAGARTMGSEFLEYLWGWQVTNPAVIKSWVWDEVKAVYIDDKLELGLDRFLEQDHNVHVKSNMLAVMLVAAQKEFWQAEQQTLEQLAQQFTDLVLANGLPGSGHTSPDHPLFDWLQSYVSAAQYQQLQQLLSATKVDASVEAAPSVVAEISLQDAAKQPSSDSQSSSQQPSQTQTQSDQSSSTEALAFDYYWLLLLGLLLVGIGWYRGSRVPVAVSQS